MNLRDEVEKPSWNEPLSSDDTSTPSFPAYKNPSLKGTHTGFPKVVPAKMKEVKNMLARRIAQSKYARQGKHRSGS